MPRFGFPTKSLGALFSAIAILASGLVLAAGVRYRAELGDREVSLYAPIGWQLVFQHAFPAIPFVFAESRCGDMYVSVMTLPPGGTLESFERQNIAILAARGFAADTATGEDDGLAVDVTPPAPSTAHLRQLYMVVGGVGCVLTLAAPAPVAGLCSKNLDAFARTVAVTVVQRGNQ